MLYRSNSDICKNLEQQITRAQTISELTRLIKSINKLKKNPSLSLDKHNQLTKIRQMAYDRKRGLPEVESRPPTFLIDTKIILIISIITLCTVFIGHLFWSQSLELYKSAGFTSPDITATGGILMVVGFATLYSITKSWPMFLLCIYAISYEGYFVVSGTIQDEVNQAQIKIDLNPEIIFFKDQLEKARNHYLENKSKYEDSKSKVYHNVWFKNTFLNPSWELTKQANQELSSKTKMLSSEKIKRMNSILKIIYRLGLVLLMMSFVHYSLTLICGYFSPHQKNRSPMSLVAT